MFGNIQMLPNSTGCHLGSIISERKVELFDLIKKRETFQIEMESLKKEYSELEKSKEHIPKTSFNLLESKIQTCASKILKLEDKLDNIEKNIKEIHQDENIFFQEVLPIDWTKSKIGIMKSRAKPADKFLKLEISSNSELDEKLEKFFDDLFNKNARTNYLDTDVFSLFNRNINDAVQKGSKVYIVGAIVSLPRVEHIDPIVLRNNPKISQELIKNADKFRVITQQILGGVFIGYEAEKTSTGTKLESRMNYVNYVCQGAIPDPCDPQTMSSLYKSWKEKLLKGDESETGYPVAFGSIKLSDFLEEQKLLNHKNLNNEE